MPQLCSIELKIFAEDKINIKETNRPHKRNTAALNQKIRDKEEEIKEKDAQLRLLKESCKRWKSKASRKSMEQGKGTLEIYL